MTSISAFKNKKSETRRKRVFLKSMTLIREFEKTIYSLFINDPVSRYIHLSIGQEAVAAGAMGAVTKNDYIALTYRNHAHLIARGASLKKMLAEIYGKKTGYCGGKGGSMHIVVPSLNIIDSNGIVGAGLPIAAGAAFALAVNNKKGVVLCFFGDGAANQGVFHETLNISALWKLPIVFICENNGYSISIPTSESASVKDISVRATAYNMPGKTINGNDVMEVYREVKQAVERARGGEGPSIIECKTRCLYGHYLGDDIRYRNKKEKNRAEDPIESFERLLIKEGTIDIQRIKDVKEMIKEKISEAVIFAQKSAFPKKESIYNEIFAQKTKRNDL